MPHAYMKGNSDLPGTKEARLYIIMVIFFFMGGILAYRLFTLQILRHDQYSAQAEKLHQVEKEIRPARGSIFVKEKDQIFPVVYNEDYYLVYSDPRKIQDTKKFIDAIAPVLGLEEDEWKDVLRRISNVSDPYEPIKRKVSKEKTEALKKISLNGVYYSPEPFRKYPEKKIGGHVFGYVDYNGKGNYGVEGYYNEALAGVPGAVRAAKDAFGETITVGERVVKKPVPGRDIVLTLDRNIQVATCGEIEKGVKEYEAVSGTVIVMDPRSGRILSMCSFPDFDPENYSTNTDVQVFNNPAIFYAYEPGSIFKVITMAMGLEMKKITPNSTYEDTGEIKIIGNNAIRNFDNKAHGVQTMTQVLEQSLNTGAVYVMGLVGKKNFSKYVKDFGFGDATGIELSAESSGNISSLEKKGEIYSLTASFGQGITVTPVQYLSAFSALINGGKLLRPSVVEKIFSEGKVVEEFQPEVVRQVISQNTSALITGMMVSAVEKGWDKKTKIEGYYVGGKTGTAQIAGKEGKYTDETNHTFVGFVPAYDPKVAVLVKLEKPKKFRFASETTTHIFRRIVEYILQYYNIPPDK